MRGWSRASLDPGWRRIAVSQWSGTQLTGIWASRPCRNRASARQAGDEERPSDLLRRDVGVLLAISLHLEPVHQHVGEFLTRCNATDKVETRFALHGLY
jgi:hypothetical protein